MIDPKSGASSTFLARGHSLASPSAAMNLFIPPYRPSPRNGGDTDSQYYQGSGGNISPYNPTAIAKSLTTGVNQRYYSYAKIVRDVLFIWVLRAAIVVGVPLVVVLMTG